MTQSAQQLIRLCLKKDPLAWEEFVRRFSSLVYWAIERSFTRCNFPFTHEDLKDTFQQVFSHLWERGLRGAEEIVRVEGWLAIVSSRITHDYMRREKRRNVFVSLEERIGRGEEGERALGELIPDANENPGEKAEKNSLEAAVKEILNSLSERESSILRLNLLEEKTHAEISELLKVPIGTVSSLIKRTKEKVALLLKKQLEGER